MSKYIIEIEDIPVGGLYKAKAFRTLVFDYEGLSRLEKVKEDKGYYYINEHFVVCRTIDTGAQEDLTRKEVGNYFQRFEDAHKRKDQILQFLNYRGLG